MSRVKHGFRLQRPVRAGLIVLALLAAVLLSGCLLGGMEVSESDNLTGNLSLSQAVEGAGSDPWLLLDALSRQAEVVSDSATAPLLQEVVLPQDARDIRTGAQGHVVGFLVDGQAREAIEDLQAGMEQEGWHGVSLGGVAGVTFTREEGRLPWIIATGNQVGGSVSIVLREVGS